jgi:hypothetical protein
MRSLFITTFLLNLAMATNLAATPPTRTEMVERLLDSYREQFPTATIAEKDHPLLKKVCNRQEDELLVVSGSPTSSDVLGCIDWLEPKGKRTYAIPQLFIHLPGGGTYAYSILQGESQFFSKEDLAKERAESAAIVAAAVKALGGRTLPPQPGWTEKDMEKRYGRRKYRGFKRHGFDPEDYSKDIPGRVYVNGEEDPLPLLPVRKEDLERLKHATEIPTPLSAEEKRRGVTIPDEYYNQK